jgi:hypothetical protein
VLLNFGIRAVGSQVRNHNSALHNVTGVLGTAVSGTFLYLIAGLNLVVLLGILKVFREMRSGRYDDQELEEQLNKRGLMNRVLGPLAGVADRVRAVPAVAARRDLAANPVRLQNRAYLRRRGIRATIPVKADQAASRCRLGRQGGRPPAFDPELYKQRHAVECASAASSATAA